MRGLRALRRSAWLPALALLLGAGATPAEVPSYGFPVEAIAAALPLEYRPLKASYVYGSVLIEHEGGWRTQYCHMAKGSVRVKVGDQMTTGQPIGLVGLSGDTEFFHLHFTVRHGGKIVDPFAYGAPENSCSGGRSLWAASLGEQMQYRPGEIIDYGFAGIAPTMELIESGEITKHSVAPGSDALVAYVRAIGLQAGDLQSLAVQGPSGTSISTNSLPALDRDKAQFLVIAGKKRAEAAWPPGRYSATYRVTRDGAEGLRKTFEVEVGPR